MDPGLLPLSHPEISAQRLGVANGDMSWELPQQQVMATLPPERDSEHEPERTWSYRDRDPFL